MSTESVFVPPAGVAATGYVTSGRGHDDHHGGHHGDLDWPSRTSERVKDVMALNATSAGEQTRDILEAICSSSAATVAAVNVQGSANSIATEKNGAAGILATNVASGAIGVAVERTSAANQLATNVASQNVLNLSLAQFNAASVQAQANAAALNLLGEKLAAAALVDATKNAAAAMLFAAQNKADSDAKAEACCCATKELIREQGEMTRALINQNERERLQGEVAQLQRQLLAGSVPIRTA
jgi:hypothetical protein